MARQIFTVAKAKLIWLTAFRWGVRWESRKQTGRTEQARFSRVLISHLTGWRGRATLGNRAGMRRVGTRAGMGLAGKGIEVPLGKFGLSPVESSTTPEHTL